MVELALLPRNANVAVIGVGTIELLALGFLLKLYKLRLLVTVASPDTLKKSIALEIGVHEVLPNEELNEVIAKKIPEGAGFDYVVEASGSPEGLQKAVEVMRPRGVIVVKSTHSI